MYFNMMELLAGVMVHIGLQNTDYMDKGNILTMLFQTMIGQEWEKNITSMRSRIKDMEDNLGRTIAHLEQTAKVGDRLEPRINELNETIRSLNENIENQKAENRKALMDVRETSQTAKSTSAEFKKETKTMKECISKLNKASDDIKKMKEQADKHLKTVELLERRLNNIIPEPEKKKGGGRSKKADTAVAKIAEEQRMEEMEAKLKEHWDKEGVK
jgi:chromosome segregation ATPase